jgi:hypothetical protein
MKTLIVAAIRCSLMFLVPAFAYAGSAEWNLNPTSGDWNTAGNWTPATVPNGSADTATFDLSNTTNVSISANTQVSGIMSTPAATNSYGITASVELTLTVSGTGLQLKRSPPITTKNETHFFSRRYRTNRGERLCGALYRRFWRDCRLVSALW